MKDRGTFSFRLCGNVALCVLAALLPCAKRAHSSSYFKCPSKKWVMNREGTRCYLYKGKRLPFLSARKICLKLDGDLLTIEDSREESFVISEVISKSCKRLKNCPIWLGLYKFSAGGWKWCDRSNGTYTNWSPSTNMMEAPIESVAVLKPDTGQWRLASVSKKKTHYGKTVCKLAHADWARVPPPPAVYGPAVTQLSHLNGKKVSNTVDMDVPLRVEQESCGDDGWILNENTSSCYYFVPVVGGFPAQRRLCLTKGSDLMSISTEEEEEYVQVKVLNMQAECALLWECNVWMGTMREKEAWAWLDQTEFAWSNWAYNSGNVNKKPGSVGFFNPYYKDWEAIAPSESTSQYYYAICEMSNVPVQIASTNPLLQPPTEAPAGRSGGNVSGEVFQVAGGRVDVDVDVNVRIHFGNNQTQTTNRTFHQHAVVEPPEPSAENYSSSAESRKRRWKKLNAEKEEKENKEKSMHDLGGGPIGRAEMRIKPKQLVFSRRHPAVSVPT